MQRMTLPLDAATPASCAARPASNGSVPRSISRRARCVVSPIPRPSTFIHFTQRCPTSFASKSPRSASDSASSSVIAASSSNGEPWGDGARSRTPWGKASRIACAVPKRSAGTPSWLPTTSPSNAPDERREVALPPDLRHDRRDAAPAQRAERGERALERFADRRVARSEETPPELGVRAPVSAAPQQRQPGRPLRPDGVDGRSVQQDFDRLDQRVVHERHPRAHEPRSTRQQQPTGHEREPTRYPPAESARAEAHLARAADLALDRRRRDELRGAGGASSRERRERLVRRLKAVFRPFGEAFHDGVGQPARDPGIHVARHRDRVGEVLADDLGAGVAVVGWRAGHHLEEHRAEGVQVAAPVEVGCPERLLGAHVLHRADGESGGRLRSSPCGRSPGIEQFRDPEIHQQRAAGVCLEHHVVGLDVAVHEPLRVGVREGLQDRFRDLERFLSRVRPAPAQRVGERFTLDERHHVVDEALGVAREVDRQDRGGLQARERLRLLAEPDEHPGGPGDLGVQHLAGEAAVEIVVPQLVDFGEPPAPHQPLHPILGAERAGETLRGRPHPLSPAPFGSWGTRGWSGDALVRDHRGRRVAARGAERRAKRDLCTTTGADHLLGGHGRKIRGRSVRCNGDAGDADVGAQHAAPLHYFDPMLFVRIALGLVLAYVALVVLAWLFQERLAFPAPRALVPDPRRVGVANGEKIELVMNDGTRLVGWYLRAVEGGEGRGEAGGGGIPRTSPHRPSPPSPAPLWFYGNRENIATIWPILREFQPPEAALLVADYPGYGGSDGRASEAGMYAAADAAYAALPARPEGDPRRLFLYGRSLGSAAATYTATRHPGARLVLQSP